MSLWAVLVLWAQRHGSRLVNYFVVRKEENKFVYHETTVLIISRDYSLESQLTCQGQMISSHEVRFRQVAFTHSQCLPNFVDFIMINILTSK